MTLDVLLNDLIRQVTSDPVAVSLVVRIRMALALERQLRQNELLNLRTAFDVIVKEHTIYESLHGPLCTVSGTKCVDTK